MSRTVWRGSMGMGSGSILPGPRVIPAERTRRVYENVCVSSRIPVCQCVHGKTLELFSTNLVYLDKRFGSTDRQSLNHRSSIDVARNLHQHESRPFLIRIERARDNSPSNSLISLHPDAIEDEQQFPQLLRLTSSCRFQVRS
jgi:hypothetical protein